MKHLLLLIWINLLINTLANFTEHFQWRKLDFALNGTKIGPKIKNDSISGTVENRIYGFQIWKDKLFLVLDPNLYGNQSIPVLNYVDLNSTVKAPTLTPVLGEDPYYIGHGNHIDIDACDRLWIMDYANWKILIIDLAQNKVIKEKTLKVNEAKNIIVDVSATDCENAYAYLPSVNDFRVRVYSLKENRIWSVYQNTSTADGIMISCAKTAGTLYVRDLTADCYYSVATDTLKNTDKLRFGNKEIFKPLGNATQNYATDVMHYDEESGILFYYAATVGSYGIGCWNTKRFPNEFSEKTAVPILPTSSNMVPGIPADIKVDKDRNLWIVMSYYGDEFPWPWTKSLITYSVYSIGVEELVNGTICEAV